MMVHTRTQIPGLRILGRDDRSQGTADMPAIETEIRVFARSQQHHHAHTGYARPLLAASLPVAAGILRPNQEIDAALVQFPNIARHDFAAAFRGKLGVRGPRRQAGGSRKKHERKKNAHEERQPPSLRHSCRSDDGRSLCQATLALIDSHDDSLHAIPVFPLAEDTGSAQSLSPFNRRPRAPAGPVCSLIPCVRRSGSAAGVDQSMTRFWRRI